MIASCDDVIVIGENRPGFELPAGFLCKGKQEAFEQVALFRSSEKMLLVQCACGDEIHSVVG